MARSQPAQQDKDRIKTFFDPLPFYYTPLEHTLTDAHAFPFYAITQRPMPMYHSWDSQNTWLRQILAQNFLYMNRKQAQQLNIRDLSWVWIESNNARVRAQVKLMEGVQENTVWTWNGVGKQRGAWGLSLDANESNDGFLLNHLISERLPDTDGVRFSNSDPITGQAAWYDLRVKIYPATESGTWPVFDGGKPQSNAATTATLRYQTHPAVNLYRSMKDILIRGWK